MEKIKAYKWLIYPVTVAAVALVLGTQAVSPGGVVSRLRSGWREVVEDRANVGRLEARVAELEGVGESEADENLKKLFLILPIKRELLLLISGLRVAAERSGVVLEGYSAAGGELKGGEDGQNLRVDVSLAGGWPGMVMFVTETERLLPLRRVVGASFSVGKGRMTVEGRWVPLAKVGDVAGEDIPDYQASLNEVLAAVAGYEMPSVASGSGVATEEVNPSLF